MSNKLDVSLDLSNSPLDVRREIETFRRKTVHQAWQLKLVPFAGPKDMSALELRDTSLCQCAEAWMIGKQSIGLDNVNALMR